MAETARALIDSSVIVRYLVGDPPELADKAAGILDVEPDLGVTDVVVVETAYVLTAVYGVAREVVVDHLIALLRKRNIDTVGIDKSRMIEGLLLCRPSGRVAFADAALGVAAREHGIPRIFTFDRRFPSEGVDLVP